MKISTAYSIINICIGFLVLYYTINFVSVWNIDAMLSSINKMNSIHILVSIFAYLAAHLVRSIRLFIIFGIKAPNIGSMIRTQLMTNGVNLLLPFKIGEAFRIAEFSLLIKEISAVLYSIIFERFLDLIFLLAVLTILLNLYGGNYESENGLSNLYNICIFLLISSIIFIIFVPNNIKELRLIIAKNSDTDLGVWWLKKLRKADLSINKIFKGVKKNSSTIITLTLIIWILELGSFVLFISVLDDFEAVSLLAVMVFLSALLPSGPLGYGGVQLSFYYVGIIYEKVDFIIYASVYQLLIFGPAIIIAIILYLHRQIRVS
jgi:hypothetical protein